MPKLSSDTSCTPESFWVAPVIPFKPHTLAQRFRFRFRNWNGSHKGGLIGLVLVPSSTLSD
eukprot:1160586-Pelagomonas_calceolata.AAC.6